MQPYILFTLAALGCLALYFSLADLPDLVLLPKGELFNPFAPLSTLWHNVPRFAVGSIVIGISGHFSYFGYFGLLSPLVFFD